MSGANEINKSCHSLVISSGLFAVAVAVCTAGLWYTGQVRILERVTTASGASIVRFTSGEYRDDIYYPNHSHIGYGQGRLFTSSLRQQGTNYHRWLDVPAVDHLTKLFRHGEIDSLTAQQALPLTPPI